MSEQMRVGVIFGGRSGEHEVSLVSATSVISALNCIGHSVLPIGITKEGVWLTGRSVLEAFKKRKFGGLRPVYFSLDPKKHYPADVIFPVLHGPYGEDGTLQGILEHAGIPYVGCGVLASATAMHKLTAKMIFANSSLPQTKFIHLKRRDLGGAAFEKITKQVASKIGFPCFVKPCSMGSSVGVSKVKKRSELAAALNLAAAYDEDILIEKAVDAREIECAVLGNENPNASLPGEIVPSNEFYDYNAKYVDNASTLIIPAKLSAEKMKEVRELSKKAFLTLQCSGMARVDFLMDAKTGKLYLNEVNTIPGFTPISMYPKLWEASGIPYAKLIDTLLRLAMEKFKEKQKNKVSFDSGSDWYQK